MGYGNSIGIEAQTGNSAQSIKNFPIDALYGRRDFLRIHHGISIIKVAMSLSRHLRGAMTEPFVLRLKMKI